MMPDGAPQQFARSESALAGKPRQASWLIPVTADAT